MAIFMKKPFTKSKKHFLHIIVINRDNFLFFLIEIKAIKVGYLNMDKHEQIG